MWLFTLVLPKSMLGVVLSLLDVVLLGTPCLC